MINTLGIKIYLDYSSSDTDDIRKCLNTLYSTREGTVPMDRDFGLNCDFIGSPMPVAKNAFGLEVISKTTKYEPRVKVKKVEYDYNEADGSMIPCVYLAKGEEG